MDYKNIFICSMIFNLMIIGLITYKVNIKPKSSINYLDTLMRNTSISIKVAARASQEGVQSILHKRPLIRRPINNGIDNIGEETEAIIDNILNIMQEVDETKSRLAIHQYFSNEKIEHISLAIDVYMERVRGYFENSILECQAQEELLDATTYMLKIQKETPHIKMEKRLEQLKYVSKEEVMMILQSIELNIRNLQYFYVHGITEVVPDREIKLDKLAAYAHILSDQKIMKGDSVEIQVGILGYSTQFAENSSIIINGVEYPMGKNGYVDFEEIPTRTGKHNIKLNARVVNPLTGEVFSGRSEFDYTVVD